MDRLFPYIDTKLPILLNVARLFKLRFERVFLGLSTEGIIIHNEGFKELYLAVPPDLESKLALSLSIPNEILHLTRNNETIKIDDCFSNIYFIIIYVYAVFENFIDKNPLNMFSLLPKIRMETKEKIKIHTC